MVLAASVLAVTGLTFGLGVHVHRTGRKCAAFPAHPLTAVVLGARVHADGSPSPALIDRVAVGVALLRDGHANRLLFSGGSPDARPTEAATMARLAKDLGAAGELLSLENTSRSTFENAARCGEWLAARAR